MSDNVVTVLNTSVGENGASQRTSHSFIADDKPLTFVANLGAGDTYVVQGRATDADDWIPIYTFSEDGWQQIYVPGFWRVIRSVDGGADGTVKVINVYNLPLVPHA